MFNYSKYINMKKLGLNLFTIFVFTSIFSQTEVLISFEINQNGSQLLLDSVLIENTTNMTDTMIYWPQNVIELDVLTSLHEYFEEDNDFCILNNYPNPLSEQSFIELLCRYKDLNVMVSDINGRKLLSKSFSLQNNLSTFVFTPGKDTQYIVTFSAGQNKDNVKLFCEGNSNTELDIDIIDSKDGVKLKDSKSDSFVYTNGDILNFTSYTTACFEVEIENLSGSPVQNETYVFDYTDLIDIQPDMPEHVSGEITETEIIWKWTEVSGASGYKYNTQNDYESATDLGNISEVEFSELDEGINYHLYVWAYNDCGVSFPLHIIEATTTTALSVDENVLITGGGSNDEFDVMSICEQPDSIILRNMSTNVNLDEENLQLLTDRMKTTVLGEGVGIAAPQIGINRNVIWVQRYDKGSALIKPWEVYFNPVIVEYSDTVALKTDGCLSVPGDCVSQYEIEGNSYRAIWVDVQYYDIDGNFVQERITHQYTAHIFQHEIDHLNGVLYFDRQIEENPDKYVIIEGDSYDGLPVID